MFVDILLKRDKKLTIGVFYRPPNRNIEPLEDLQNVLSEISTTNTPVLGDFNISEMDWHNTIKGTPLHNLLIEIIHDNIFTLMVSRPTRGQNILDLILTTSVDYVQDIIVGEEFSDHNQITFHIDCAPYAQRKPRKQYYSFKKAERGNLKDLFYTFHGIMRRLTTILMNAG